MSTAQSHHDYDHERQPTPPGLLTRVSWGAIFAGGVAAIALMIMFSLLGFGLGFGTINPLHESDPFSGIGIGGGIYFIVTQLISLAVGGFVAAKLSGVAATMIAGLHGFAVWSIATIGLIWMAISGASTIIGGVTSAAGQIAQSAGSAVQSMIPDNVQMPSLNIDDLDTGDLPPQLQQVLEENNISVDRFRRVSKDVLQEVVPQQERDEAMKAVQSTALDIVRSPGDADADLQKLREQIIGKNGVLTDQDIETAKNMLSRRLGIDQQKAQAVIDNWQQQLNQVADQVEQTVQETREQAVQFAQGALDTATNASLLAFFAMLLGLIAAVVGGVVGRPSTTRVTG